jgi:hypothetical protein
MDRTLIVGLGSPAGDDQAGWKLVEMLGERLPAGAHACALREPTKLWDVLGGCERLIVIDAVRTGRAPGTVCRLVWPAPAVEACFCTSMGTGPAVQGGADLSLFELPAHFVLEVGTEQGGAVLAAAPLAPLHGPGGGGGAGGAAPGRGPDPPAP